LKLSPDHREIIDLVALPESIEECAQILAVLPPRRLAFYAQEAG
jgi:hypothetical protein